MKKFVLFSMLGLLLTNCSNQDVAIDNGIDTSSESSFLSVSIVTTGTPGTRVASDEDSEDNYPKGDGTYKDGTAEENKVNSVLILFFNDQGEPANAVSNGEQYLSYYLWQNVDNDNVQEDHDQTVEKILNEVIHIRVPRRNDVAMKPTQLFAVVNPTDVQLFINKSLVELRDIVEDYETSLTNGNFVMTNSVYVKGGSVMDATPVEEEHYQSTEALAKAHPVVIYVERVLARIDLKIDIKGTNEEEKQPKRIGEGDDAYYIYYTGKSLDGEEIYVRFRGWNVFDTPAKSRLIKHVNTEWEDSDIFGTPTAGNSILWNSADYHRSFWAINPPKDRFEYREGTFEGTVDDSENGSFSLWTAKSLPVPAYGEYSTAYFQENAAPYEEETDVANAVLGAPTKPSRVILAGQLVDEYGNPYDLASWAGRYMTWENLKKYICNDVLNLYYWSEYGKDDKGNATNIYKKIEPEDIKYQTSGDGGYKVSIVLSEAAQEKTWFISKNDASNASVTSIESDKVNEHIADMIGDKTVMYWRAGNTYFHFKIRHLGEEGSAGYYGVVRNHIYDATVTALTGLGTPVADPDEIIIPTDDEETGILAAKVEILSWRVVRQDYELNW